MRSLPMTPEITTIITTYRRPHLLKKAILSALNQTFSNIQVCVYDNASRDGTEQIVRELMQCDPRIKYHCHTENIGMMANYQYALSQISTPYFSLLSDDDQLLPEFYKIALQSFQQYPEIAFCACGVRAIDEKEYFVSSPISMWNRTGYFSALEGFDEMITKPLLPVGVLFQTNQVKEIQPDLSHEIQIRWDTDYLLQIIERHPYFINGEICALFLAHSNGFSTGNYRQMHLCAKKFEKHVHATKQMIHRIEKSKKIPSTLKEKPIKELHQQLNIDFRNMIANYFEKKLTKASKELFRLYVHTYGFGVLEPQNFKGFLKSWLINYLPQALPLLLKARNLALKKKQ